EMTLEDELRYTKSYVPTILNENDIPDVLKPIIRNLECRELVDIVKSQEGYSRNGLGRRSASFVTSVENASSKGTDKSVPSADQTDASPGEGEKNTNDADNANLNQQPTTITPPTTSSFQSPFFPKSKGKEVMSSKDAEEKETESYSEDNHANPADFTTEEQKRIEESLNAELAKQEVEKVKDELVDLMGIDVVTRPLKEQDPLDELNDLANKKRKRADDLKDHSKSTKKHKSSVQHEKESEKSKSLVSATPLSTAFLTTSIVQDFQDSPDDEDDTRSSHEYLNDLEEEYQARARGLVQI
ncbi:hypothetical protein Tco_0633186, partial [Tanacetum coccineum]